MNYSFSVSMNYSFSVSMATYRDIQPVYQDYFIQTSIRDTIRLLMCLIIFAHQAAPRFPLVLAANRDEFFTRPTAEADFWNQQKQTAVRILAGRDLLAGGAWLGITRTGRFAAVTNIRDPSQPEQKTRSRGELTINFLRGGQSAAEYCESLMPHLEQFAGFNLLIGDGETIYYVNNHAHLIRNLEPGIYGLSNGLLNSDWPKVNRGRERLAQLIGDDMPVTSDALIAMMANRERAADHELPNTGAPIELERELSATFIENSDRRYGTRCSTAIIMEDSGATRFSEQNYDENGKATTAHYYEFNR